MPVIKSVKKALRGSERKAKVNLVRKRDLKKVLKKMEKLVTSKNTDGAKAYMPEVQKILDKSAKTGIMKKNTVSRKKSRIVASIKRISK